MVMENEFWSGKSQGILFPTKIGHPVIFISRINKTSE